MSETPLPAARDLPSAVRDLLWDVAAAEVRLPRHRDFLIGRILTRGTWLAVEWSRRELTDAAIAQRGAKKDFFDLHALLREGHTLPELLQAFARKYSNADPARVLVGLCYFDDADLDPDPVRLTSPAWETVREEIRQATLSVVGTRHQAG
jgi:hypothetical protein